MSRSCALPITPQFSSFTIIRSDIRLGFRQADDFARFLPLTAFLEQFDALEPFQNVALGGNGTGSAETAML